MDPLSDILSLLKPNSYGFRGLDAGRAWALSFGADDSIRCYAVQSG
ncbi:AraC family transcriptional regulator, partial [Pseudomonas sp. FW305-130]